MKALLSVSFGTSHEETRAKTIDVIEGRLRDEFPEWPLRSAWTSGRVVAKVKAERGEHHDTLQEAFDKLSADGVDELIVSTTCLMKGGEMAKITKAAEDWVHGGKNRRVGVTKPLLWAVDDRQAVARVIRDEFSNVAPEDALLLMGHGSPQGANGVYVDLRAELLALGCGHFFVATVEGAPTFDDVWPLVEETEAECVHLAPLMVVAGDHALNDMAGDQEDSWARRIEAQGLRTKAVLRGLGEYAGIQKLVCDHVREALLLREVALRG